MKALVVGVGGIGCPCAIALARAGVDLRLCDDDVVDASNLHRQILFDESSVGKPKLDEAARALRAMGANVETVATRFLPNRARELIEGCDVVVEGADNFPTKFLVADACALAKVPVVHAAAVRLHGTVLAVAGGGKPCYRCIFEDLPPAGAPTCETAGVLGPMVGVIGALQADLALSLLERNLLETNFVSYDAGRDFLRRRSLHGRGDCALCTGRIDDLDERRYIG